VADNTRISGPIFDGRADAAVRAFIDAAEDEIGQEGVDMVHTRLAGVLRHPTGYYESKIHTERQHGDTVVTDGGVIYGPWLEGTGSRNRTTRFKGYATFRRVRAQLQARAKPIAERVLPPYLRRMG
jgi:hypothetical protein